MAWPTIILKYDSSFYQTKIDTFESLNSQLREHLERLEQLKQQIPDFWEEEATARYIEAIAIKIGQVRQASDDVTGMRDQYQKIIDEQSRVGTAVDDTVDEIWETTTKPIEVAGPILKNLI